MVRIRLLKSAVRIKMESAGWKFLKREDPYLDELGYRHFEPRPDSMIVDKYRAQGFRDAAVTISFDNEARPLAELRDVYVKR